MRPTLPFLATQFKLLESTVALGAVAFTQVLGVNTNRYAVILCSVTGGQINLTRNPNGPLTGSLTLANAANASVQYVILRFEDIGALVQDAWFAKGDAAAQTIGVNEILYLPTA